MLNVEIQGYLNQKFFKFTLILLINFLIIHYWIFCKCPYYETIDNNLTLFKNALHYLFVGPPFTDNENWTFHPIQTLFNVDTYKDIYERIIQRDYESIILGPLRFIPRLFKRFHPKPFSHFFIYLSMSAFISISYFIILKILRTIIIHIPKLREKFILYFSISKEEREFYIESNDIMENMDPLKPLPNYDSKMFEYRLNYLEDPSIYDSPLYADFHYPILCHDQQESNIFCSYIYVVPENLNKVLGGSITIQTLSKLVNDELKKQNLYNGNDFTIRCPVDLGIFRNIHPDSLFNLVKLGKIKVLNFNSNPFIITVKNITKQNIKIYFPKGSIIESNASNQPCIVTKGWIAEIMPNRTKTVELQCIVKYNEPPDGSCLLTPFVLNANENQIKNYWNEMKNMLSPTTKVIPSKLYDIKYHENKEDNKINEQNEEPEDESNNDNNNEYSEDEQMGINEFLDYYEQNPNPGGFISPELRLIFKENEDKISDIISILVYYHRIPIENQKTGQFSSCTRLKYEIYLSVPSYDNNYHSYLIKKDEKSSKWKGRSVGFLTNFIEDSVVPSFSSFDYYTEISLKSVELALLLDKEEFDYDKYNSYHSVLNVRKNLQLPTPIMIDPSKFEIFSVPIDPSSLIQ